MEISPSDPEESHTIRRYLAAAAWIVPEVVDYLSGEGIVHSGRR